MGRDVRKREDGSLDWSEMSIGQYDLFYPGCGERASPTLEGADVVEVELVHVRAARGVRIYYDFERDGYVVTANVTDPDVDPSVNGERWMEKAFVPAWEE